MNEDIIKVFLTEDIVTIADGLINGEFTQDELIHAFCDLIVEIDDKSFLEEQVSKLVNASQYAALNTKQEYDDEDYYDED